MKSFSYWLFFGLEAGVFLTFLGVFLSVSLIGLGTSLVLIFGAIYVARHRTGVLFGPMFVPLLAVAMAIGVSILLADAYPYLKPLGKIRYLLCALFIALYFSEKPSAKDWVIGWGWFLAIVLGGVAVLQFFGIFSPLPFFGGRSPSPIPQAGGMYFLATGFAFHHNPFASTLVVLFHVFFARCLLAVGRSRKWYWAFPASFCVVGIACSFSRSGWIAWAVSTVFVAVCVSWRKALAVLTALVAVGGAEYVLLPAFRQRALDMRFSQNADRLEAWRICFEMFKDAPWFGQGFYSFGSRYQKYTEAHLQRPHFPVEAHNMYMDFLSGTGLVGLVAFFYFLWSWIRLALRKFGDSALSPEDRAWALACAGMWASFVVAGIFDKQFYMSQTLVAQMFFIGVLCSLGVSTKSVYRG